MKDSATLDTAKKERDYLQDIILNSRQADMPLELYTKLVERIRELDAILESAV